MWLVLSSDASLTTREKGRKSGGGRDRDRDRETERWSSIGNYTCAKKTIKTLCKEIRDVGGREGG